MEKIILFGNGKIAEAVMQSVLDTGIYEITAFTVDKRFMDSDSFNGFPVLPFEEIEKNYSPGKYKMFIAVGYQDMNDLRTRKMEEAGEKGFDFVNIIDSGANLYSDLQLGKNCFIMNDVNIQPRVSLGDNVFVWSGAVIGHHSSIGNHVWITSGANISGIVEVGDSCFFAINSTVANNVKIGERCFLGANALITKDLEENKVVIAQANKPIRLSTDQFLRMSNFNSL
jgi:sugar O-acyltransferase (sialic acid O-acetyltransferase NeuD family)